MTSETRLCIARTWGLDYLTKYSPYDNVTKKAYPTMLVKTSLNDRQVMYWERAKYVARLRAMKTDSNLLVFKINMDPAGYGGQSGRYNRLQEIAFDYAFILWQFGVVQIPSPNWK
jgi:oligopeptidase B